jgi:alpha-amylase/alpha-mannosidase (GH57 family)
MIETTLHLAIVLHMHQPRYNLIGPAYESKVAVDVFGQTIHPYTYPTEAIKRYEKARVTFNYTGSLVEQLDEFMNVDFDPRLKDLWNKFRELKKLRRAEFTGCGYFHPIFPLIPEEDCRKQIEMHLEVYKETFGGRPSGLWLPELAFRMNVIPLLEEMGFKWVIVDGPHVVNANKNKDRNGLLYYPHYAEYDGHTIIVVPRDRDISNAQQSGYNPIWLKNEVEHKIQPFNDGRMLLTVATDGENGWFRHFGENAGFWGWFFEPLLYLLNKDPDFQFIKLTTVDEYLNEYPPEDTVVVEDGSWNVPGTFDDGRFLKWTEGNERQEAWTKILETSKLVHEFDEKIEKLSKSCVDGLRSDLKQAWRWLLMAEASDYFWWGAQDWLNQAKICCMKAKEKIEESSRML